MRGSHSTSSISPAPQLVDLAGQVELSQRARGELTQRGLCVFGARLVGDDMDENLCGATAYAKTAVAVARLFALATVALRLA